jgi:hypothetical protein
MNELTRCCPKCGIPLPKQTQAKGRPAQYCSTACRRAAEFEIRRLNDVLATLEKNASHARLWGRSSSVWLPPEKYAAEIERAETRLRELLAQGGDAGNTPTIE